MMLHVKLPFNIGETAASYASRYAHRCGCRAAADFCGDIGTTFFAIIAGAEEGFACLKEASGVPISTLSASSPQRYGERYLMNGQHLTKGTLNARLRICPICLQEDTRQNPILEFAAPWCRNAWLISSIRTCLYHGVELVYVVDADKHSSMSSLARWDFTRLMLPIIEDENGLEKLVKCQVPSRLEQYLFDRLNGVSPRNSWLNEFPFHAAARACEVVGAVKRHGGEVNLTALTEEEWRSAGVEGFDILTEGQESFRDFVEALRPKGIEVLGAYRLKALFGQLYLWLRNSAKDPAYDLMRDVLRDVALDSIEMRPEEMIFDRPVGKRRLHSLRSAGDEIGMHYQCLAKHLRDAGFIEPGEVFKSANSVLIPADDRLDEILKRLSERLGFVQAARYINATRMQFEQLLEDGVINPITGKAKGANPVFTKTDLDDFLCRLMDGAIEGRGWGAHSVDISQAARKLICKNLQIVQLILERKVKNIGCRPGTFGLEALILDFSEIQAVLGSNTEMDHSKEVPKTDDCGYMPMHDVEKCTGWSRRVVSTLVQQRWISAYRNGGFGGDSGYRISQSDLKAFDGEYIHSFALAKQLNIARQRVRRTMLDAGVRPALDCTPAVFYRRDDVMVM